MEKFNELKVLLDTVEEDIKKFYEKGNKVAGTRIRKSMQEIKKLAQDIRVEIQNIKNT